MIEGGYILQPRVIDDSEVSKMSPVTRELWFYILRKVNHSDYKKLKRGQGFFRLGDIQEDLSWYVGFRKEKYTISQLSKSLRRLRESNMIATMKATHGVVVTVCKYDYYQCSMNYEGNTEGNAKVKNNAQYKQELKKEKNENGNKLYENQKSFKDHLKLFIGEFGKEMIDDFYDYWSEPNAMKTKLRWQLEKTWDTKRRLQRWRRNRVSFCSNGQRPGQILKTDNKVKTKKILENAGF